jgi:predicted O-methyltransferase YrrM
MLSRSRRWLRTAAPPALARRWAQLHDYPRYAASLWTGRPYFGSYMQSAQTWTSRAPHMRAAIDAELRRRNGEPFQVLEIGSWAGQSAVLWAQALREHANAGRVLCIDPWQPYMRDDYFEGAHETLTVMDRAARRDRIFGLFWHNVKASGVVDHVVPIRGRSHDVLSLLREARFDLVFVDGSHAYSDCRRDLELAAPLVRDGGLLCGDDLELQLDAVDAEFAEASREADYVRDPKSQRDFHPGVCLAVARFFGRRVSAREGFWLQRRRGESWEDVAL